MNAPAPPTPEPSLPTPALPSAAVRRRWGRWWHWLLVTFGVPLVLALLLGGVAWVWTGTDTSLASAVRLAAQRLPADQTLVAEGITGSVRAGGRIALLRWQRAGLAVEARDIAVAWEWPLLPKMVEERSLRLQTLSVGTLRIDDQRAPSTEPFQPPDELMLPIVVDVPLNVGTVTFTGPPAWLATGLAGRYRFDGTRHDVDVTALHWADGRYRGTASLLARAPMTLDLNLQGEIHAVLPGTPTPLPLVATATVRGPLAGTAARLAVDAQLRPLTAGGGAAPPMQATLTAVVSPWAAQPVVQARAALSRVNVGALWPDAPQTLLSGDVRVAPVAGPAPATVPAWSVESSLTNALAGPWDQRRVPVQRLVVSGVVEAGRVVVRRLDADAAGGKLQAEGTWTGIGTTGNRAQVASGWQGTVSARGVNPAAVLGALAPAVLDGQLKARAERGAIAFDAQLKPAAQQPSRSPLQGLRLKSADARGQWRGGARGTVAFEALTVQTDDATLQGPLEFNIASRATSGHLTLIAPGTQATLRGALSAGNGSGTFALRIVEAGPALRWLATLPGSAARAGQVAASGAGELDGSWQGGWQNQGQGLQVDAQVRAPLVAWRSAGASSGPSLRDVQADLSGRLSALTLRTSGLAETGTRRSRWTAQLAGGQTSATRWQGQLQALTLQSSDTVKPGTWTVQLRQPVALDWTAGAQSGGGGTLDAAAGEAALVGPVPGSAVLAWDAMRYVHGPRTELRSAGQLLNVPLGWLEVLGDTQLAQLGLRGSLVFDGGWDVHLTDTLRVSATLARRSGDLSVQADEFAVGNGAATGGASAPRGALARGPALVSAGVRDVRLTLSAEGETVRAGFKWDSERAGRVDADVTTRVARRDGAWVWPADAPLAGTLMAQLPRVGVWSVLAPPGWRIRGTLDANATLAGTRQAPQWRGSLNADDLAMRSVVEGIEFSEGRLRTTLSGQRLEITEFTLRGASAGTTAPGAGGRLTATGFAEWLPEGASGGAGRGLTKVRISLDAQAQALRVSARADRRLVVSGQLQARLEQARLEVRGNLRADQALFVLPDENAPTLGNDVVVRGRGQTVTATTSAPTDTTGGVQVQPDLQVALDLGDDFRVQGRGLATRLAGKLNLRSNAATGNTPRLDGEVRAVRGTYKAYGQQLDIEEGLLRFSGRYDNPTLDILAIRPNMSQRVGVQITGTALAPRVRLYSDPELPDAEKLGWLVLGRAAANGGAESAVLQQAALALLGGNSGGLSGGIAEALGLDELSFRGQASRADGTTSAAAVTLGKRLSRDFYVAYERSLTGTLGTFYVFYDLSRRFTLRAQTGEQSAIDLIFTVPYD